MIWLHVHLMISVSVKVKLSRLNQRRDNPGEVKTAGLLAVCVLDGGGDGGGSARPAALLW